MNLDYNNSFIPVLSASVLGSLFYVFQIWMQSYLNANLISSPYLSLKYLSCLPIILQSKVSTIARKILYDLTLFPLPLLVFFLWPSVSQSMAEAPSGFQRSFQDVHGSTVNVICLFHCIDICTDCTKAWCSSLSTYSNKCQIHLDISLMKH